MCIHVCSLVFTVQSKDLQGHPYTLKKVHVRFSDPQLEPTPAAELQSLLSEAVKCGVWEGKQPLVHYGSITTNGRYIVCTMYIHVHVNVYSICNRGGEHEVHACYCIHAVCSALRVLIVRTLPNDC